MPILGLLGDWYHNTISYPRRPHEDLRCRLRFEQSFGTHSGVEPCRQIRLVPAKDDRQPIVGNCVSETFEVLRLRMMIIDIMMIIDMRPGGAFPLPPGFRMD